MTMPCRVTIALVLPLLFGFAAPPRAGGEVPTAADVAACNAQAPGAIKTGSAAPNLADEGRAERARDGAAATTATDLVRAPIESSDPQIHGMEGEGAKDAAYQAAYRSCMRRKGF